MGRLRRTEDEGGSASFWRERLADEGIDVSHANVRPERSLDLRPVRELDSDFHLMSRLLVSGRSAGGGNRGSERTEAQDGLGLEEAASSLARMAEVRRMEEAARREVEAS